MLSYKTAFDTHMWVKSAPNSHEVTLFQRAKKYIGYLRFIPGVQMVAVVNSLSMYATHVDSDIDLFIITEKDRIWFVRVWVTLIFYFLGVWRKGEDIAGNFCLSFFITEEFLDLQKIAIEDDIYLYNWIYHLKPIMTRGDIYERLLLSNTWVEVSENQRNINTQYLAYPLYPKKSLRFWSVLEVLFRYFGETKARASAQKLDDSSGIIVSKDILKFHDHDKRKSIREKITIRK